MKKIVAMAAVLLLAFPAFAQSGAAGGGNAATGAAGGASTMDGGAGFSGNVQTNTATGAAVSGMYSTNPSVSGTTSWNAQNTYWQHAYPTRPYYNRSRNYSTMAPAYQYGVNLYNQHPGTPYQNLNRSQLRTGWNRMRNTSNLSWSNAQAATRDAYTRLYNQNTRNNGAAGNYSPSR